MADKISLEPILPETTTKVSDYAAGRNSICPICARSSNDPLVDFQTLSDDLKAIVSANAVSGATARARVASVCPRCVRLFERARVQLESDAVIFEQHGGVLPTPMRLGADERFTGRGVTMAFLDSGFYPHPDLTTPRNRIIAYQNMLDKDALLAPEPDAASWHGMMTSVVAAGNGALSDGFYRGIAPEANLVLVKLATSGRISEAQIEAGLNWILEHKDEFNIRVVNISAGGDRDQSYLQSTLSNKVEELVKAGIVIVCAVGNAGNDPGHPVLPPASAPSSIAVGGLDDQNSLDRARRGMYRSSYGPTFDGLQKPEIIAPGIWIPAPILPDTATADQAELYATLNRAPDEELQNIIEAHATVDEDLYDSRDLPVPLLRYLITVKLREDDVINEHYKYVDGTSFAAPVVSSIVACMLEANLNLTPQQVKRILIDTAERLPGIEIDRQGWGVVAPHRAVEFALALRG